MKPKDIEFHPLSTLFPAVEGDDFQVIVDDVKANGLRQAITLFKGQILDGRTRYLACKAASVEPRFETYMGADPVRYVVSLNVARRHLTDDQRRMVAAEVSQIAKLSRDEAATMMSTDVAGVDRAKSILKRGDPRLADIVKRGEISVAAAAEIASRPHNEQVEIVARGRTEIIRMAAIFREEDRAINREQRDKITVELGEMQERKREQREKTMPPWEFVPWSGSERLIQTYEDLVDVFVARRKALGWSQQELDDRAGWEGGYAGKLEAWMGPQGRIAGAVTMPLWWQALGLRLLPVSVSVADEKQKVA